MSAEFALWMFPALMVMIFMGFPVAFSLLSVAFVFGALRFNFSPFAANVFAQKVDQVAAAYVLGAVPLFIFMGSLMERSGIAERLFEAIHLWTRRLPGGLAVGTVILCVIFAAASGVVGATESVVGLLAIPVMLRYAYDKGLISGTICAGGSLGTVIPPSVIVVILGPVAEVDVGGLFMGMLFPGLLLAGLFILYILVRCTLRPQDGQRLPPDENDPSFARKLVITAVALVPPLILIFAVLGTILLGWATPTEAAAMGAAGSIIMVLLYGNFTWGVLKEALVKTLLVTAMILMILLAGNIFATVFAIAGGMVTTQNLVESAGLSGWATMGLLAPPRVPRRVRAGPHLDHPDHHPHRDADHRVVHLPRPRSERGEELVLHPVPHRYPDELPHAADGPRHLLPARHLAAGDPAGPHVPGRAPVHRARDHRARDGHAVARPRALAAGADAEVPRLDIMD